jgi:hypothetical protein
MTVPGLGGAPLKYAPNEFETKIVDYFKFVDEENKKRRLQRFTGEKLKPYTISGICVFLEVSRETWREYGKKPEFAEAIKRAKTIVENYVEEGLLNGSINAIGGIFNLKNNFGWVDKIDINTTNAPEQLTPNDIKRQLMERNKEDTNK